MLVYQSVMRAVKWRNACVSKKRVICKNWCGWKFTVPWKSVTNKKLGPLVLSMFLLFPEVTIDVMTWICESFFWQGKHLWFKNTLLKTTIIDVCSDPIRINKRSSHLFQPNISGAAQLFWSMQDVQEQPFMVASWGSSVFWVQISEKMGWYTSLLRDIIYEVRLQVLVRTLSVHCFPKMAASVDKLNRKRFKAWK